MKNWLKENWFKIGLLIIISFGLTGYLKYVKQELTQEQENIYRKECIQEKKDDMTFFDKKQSAGLLGPSVVQQGLKDKGYTDGNGKFIDNDVWIAKCVQKKISIML